MTTFKDILDTREALLPEQKRMPTHLFTWTEKYGFKSWTIKETGTPENIDDRSTGVVQFLNAIMPTEFPDRFKAGQPPFHVPWVTSDFPQVDAGNMTRYPSPPMMFHDQFTDWLTWAMLLEGEEQEEY